MNTAEIYQWMLEQRELHRDPLTGEVNCTRLAQAAEIEFDAETEGEAETLSELALWASEA